MPWKRDAFDMLAKRLQSLIPRMLQLYKKCFLVTQSMLNLKSGYKSIEDHSGPSQTNKMEC